MPKYLSGRAKRVPQDQLSEDRYRYLGLDQAEPNLSDPLVAPSAPTGAQYQLIAIPGFPGKRYWVPVGGGLVPGAITIFDENSPVSSSSSITQLNFVGAAVTANVSVQSPSGHPGIAATVTVIPVTVGDEPPNIPNPNNGELWWESDTGDLYVYYNDGDSSQWVMANAGGRGLTGDKGQKGEVGTTTKGQKGEVGADNSTKGQKGEPSQIPGTKGQKGEVGAQGNPGTGTKGQKGEAGDEGFLANSGKTGSYTLVAADDQKLINTNSGITVPSGVFSAPDAVTIVNNSTGNITITQGSGVSMYYAGSSTTGNRVLAQKGIATLVCISNNNFVISGAGLS